MNTAVVLPKKGFQDMPVASLQRLAAIFSNTDEVACRGICVVLVRVSGKITPSTANILNGVNPEIGAQLALNGNAYAILPEEQANNLIGLFADRLENVRGFRIDASVFQFGIETWAYTKIQS